MKGLKGFGRYWYDFIIGDDWKIAAAVLAALAVFFVIMKNHWLHGDALVIAGALLIMYAFFASLFIDVKKTHSPIGLLHHNLTTEI